MGLRSNVLTAMDSQRGSFIKDMKNAITAAIVSLGIVAGLVIGFSLGQTRERLRCLDTHIYWFARYSEHLNELVEQQNYHQLTNDITLFEKRFKRHEADPKALQDTMYQIMGAGPYYKGTNERVTN